MTFKVSPLVTWLEVLDGMFFFNSSRGQVKDKMKILQ